MGKKRSSADSIGSLAKPHVFRRLRRHRIVAHGMIDSRRKDHDASHGPPQW
jgi:hypothetical protein